MKKILLYLLVAAAAYGEEVGFFSPARIDTRTPDGVWIETSFLYWQPMQSNMELGIANQTPHIVTTSTDGNTGLGLGMGGNIIPLQFGFKPGFTVGIGRPIGSDDWDLSAAYTWFHHEQTTSATAPAGGVILDFQAAPSDEHSNVYNSSTGTWRLHLDVLEGDLGRWFYHGKDYTLRPYLGARATFIRQHYTILSINNALYGGSRDNQTIKKLANSWGFGPRMGLDGNWCMGKGIRLFGDASADVLYTQYTTLSYKSTHTANPSSVFVETFPVAIANQSVRQQNIGAIRTHLDLELGMGWDTYFSDHTKHIDITASYGYQVFFNQNMFRSFLSDVMRQKSVISNGNLFIQGLTATVRFDF